LAGVDLPRAVTLTRLAAGAFAAFVELAFFVTFFATVW
jgi:hypothetical protein